MIKLPITPVHVHIRSYHSRIFTKVQVWLLAWLLYFLNFVKRCESFGLVWNNIYSPNNIQIKLFQNLEGKSQYHCILRPHHWTQICKTILLSWLFFQMYVHLQNTHTYNTYKHLSKRTCQYSFPAIIPLKCI